MLLLVASIAAIATAVTVFTMGTTATPEMITTCMNYGSYYCYCHLFSEYYYSTATAIVIWAIVSTPSIPLKNPDSSPRI